MARTRAITLVELLLAVSLISLVMLSAGALFTAAGGFFSTFSVQAEMQNQANIALQHIVRRICLTKDVEILSSAGLPAESGPRIRVTKLDETTYEYWQEGSDVKCDEGGSGETIATGVNELRFSDYQPDVNSQRVTLSVNLTMKGKEKLRLQPLDFVTKITLRKYE